MELHEDIIRILAERGIKEPAEDYESKMPKSDLVSELTLKGYSKESINQEIEKLCINGSLAMDEINIYVYDQPL